jgi:hypothetical protein
MGDAPRSRCLAPGLAETRLPARGTDRTFPAVKVGGLTRINRPRLERWLERQHRTRKPLRSSPDAVGKTGEATDAAKALR